MDNQNLKALKSLLTKIENLDDVGPEGEGWQSDEYLKGLLALRIIIAELEGKVNG